MALYQSFPFIYMKTKKAVYGTEGSDLNLIDNHDRYKE